jgi:hypothetical protein
MDRQGTRFQVAEVQTIQLEAGELEIQVTCRNGSFELTGAPSPKIPAVLGPRNEDQYPKGDVEVYCCAYGLTSAFPSGAS